MGSTRQLTITLPDEVAQAVCERVRSGQYASESEVVQEGLETLLARDQALDEWLRGPVAAAYDRIIADPNSLLSAEEVRAHLAARHTTNE
ncbi:MAG: hypothetical protein LBJ08_07420 [Bifidobacteriaceae bacterium]|jgi:Arc/MetJ-type ribon-helix-helix transcriptional regulator|nr:hypothetical protein [Bifidobacteriaceae bacterium]